MTTETPSPTSAPAPITITGLTSLHITQIVEKWHITTQTKGLEDQCQRKGLLSDEAHRIYAFTRALHDRLEAKGIQIDRSDGRSDCEPVVLTVPFTETDRDQKLQMIQKTVAEILEYHSRTKHFRDPESRAHSKGVHGHSRRTTSDAPTR